MTTIAKKRWQPVFDRFRRRAARLVERPAAAVRLAERALERPDREPGPLGRMLEDVHCLVRLVRAWARGEYRAVSKTTIVAVVAGLAYLLSPVDAILDALPVIGLVDDTAVLGWVLAHVRVELEAFRRWETSSRDRQPGVAPSDIELPSHDGGA